MTIPNRGDLEAARQQLDRAERRIERIAERTSVDLRRLLDDVEAARVSVADQDAGTVDFENAAYEARLAPERARHYALLELRARCLEAEWEIDRLCSAPGALGAATTGAQLRRQVKAARPRSDGNVGDLVRAEQTLAKIRHEAWQEIAGQAVDRPEKATRIVLAAGDSTVPAGGLSLLVEALLGLGRLPVVSTIPAATSQGDYVLTLDGQCSLADESYRITSGDTGTAVTARSQRGLLYGCVGLVEAIARDGRATTPPDGEAPVFDLRGTMFWPPVGGRHGENRRTTALYGEPQYAAHPDWFYDAAQWLRFFDRALRSRLNLVVLWHSHFFPFLIKMTDYPEGRELSPERLGRNMATFQWVIDRAAGFGLRLGTMNWNIHLSRSFRKAHGIPIDDHPLTELTEDYTRAITREFLETYPEIGAVGFCPGEQVSGDSAEFLERTQLRALREFHEATGRSPLLLVRNWSSGPREVSSAVRRSWGGEAWMDTKYQAEFLDISRRPDPEVAEAVQDGDLPVYGYFHMLSNLWPFTFGSAEHVYDCLHSLDEVGARGVVFHPLNVEGWPYTWERRDDKLISGKFRADPERFQFDRDWIWWSAFGRYAWNPRQPYEQNLWLNECARRCGNRTAGGHLYRALEAAAAIMPAIGTQFWVRGWDHWRPQINGLNWGGSARTQRPSSRYWVDVGRLLKDRPRHHLVADIPAYVNHQLRGTPLAEGRTPIDTANSIVAAAGTAGRLIELAAVNAERGHHEIESVRKDIEVLGRIAEFWRRRIHAAIATETFVATLDERFLAEAEGLVRESVRRYRQVHDRLLAHYEMQPALCSHARLRPRHLDNLLGEAEKEAQRFRQDWARLGILLATGPQAVMIHAGGTAADFERGLRRALRRRRRGLAVMGGRVPHNLSRCRLITLSHDMSALRAEEGQRVLDWVGEGGKLLLWCLNETNWGADGAVLHDFFPARLRIAPHKPAGMLWSDVDHPLLAGLAGRSFAEQGSRVSQQLVADYAPSWDVLAGANGAAFIVSHQVGSGEIVVAQWPAGFRDTQMLASFVGNTVAWAGI